MTNGEYLINKLKEKRKQYKKAVDELEEAESELCGMEIDNYKDNVYAVVEFVFEDHISIYCESDDGDVRNEQINLDELLNKCK